jgi:hypothetical protein
MRAVIDAEGRLMLPMSLLDQVGLRPGLVEVLADAVGLRVEPVDRDVLAERGGRLVVPQTGVPIDGAAVRSLRRI